MEREMDLSDGEETKVVAHIPATFAPPSHGTVSDRSAVWAAHGNSTDALGKGIEREYNEQLPGYIFLCNGKTKPECYRYRVFGLPKGRKDIIENIKPGMKLFLYDFEKKLLYGIYEATVGGKLNIEPDAFEKKYPAQVGFRIFKNCYPLPEKTFKSAIHENYRGSKFKQQLSPQQVTNLLSLFRPFTAPELDSVAQELASRSSLSRTLPFEERFIISRNLRLASSVLDPLSVPGAEPQCYSYMPHQSVAHNSYSRQTDYTNSLREPLSLSSLSKQYYATETRQRHLLGDPPRSSIKDPQLKYLTILSNIRRYGTDPERTATDMEYYPAPLLGNEHYASTYTGNGYYPSTVTGNELPSASAAGGNAYYPSTSSANEFYALTSQKEGKASQISEIPAANYYHQQVSTALDATVSAHAVHVAQSHVETSGYPSLAHGQELGSTPQQPAEAIDYGHQQQNVPIGYATHPNQGSVEDNGQSFAGAMGYTQQQHIGATGYNPQHYAGATGYNPQSYDTTYAYAQQMHAEAIGYAPQTAAPHSGPPGASGTADWDSNQLYSMNQSYYPYTADPTSSYNQT